MNGGLIVSVSGITAATLDYAAGFALELDRRGVSLSLLVTPRLPGGYRLVADHQTQQWLRGRSAAGDAVVLHGYDQTAGTRRHAEFAALGQHEAALRLLAADRVLEEAGLRTRIFAAPGWNASAGALAALPGAGFRLVAGLTTVLDLERDSAVRSRVHGIISSPAEAGQHAAEPWLCKALVLSAARVARRGGLLRLGFSAAQLSRPGPRQAALDAIDIALHHGAVPTVYRWEPRPHSLAA